MRKKSIVNVIYKYSHYRFRFHGYSRIEIVMIINTRKEIEKLALLQ